MGLKLASTLAITALCALVYAIVFAIVVATMGASIFGLILIIGLTFGIVMLQYLISPLIVSWIYRINWIPYDDYKHQFPHLAAVVKKVCEEKGTKIPRLGIIQDLNPNP